MWHPLAEISTSTPSDIWTVIGSTLGGLVLIFGAYFTRHRPSRSDEVDEQEPEPERSVRKAARTTATSAVDEYRSLIEAQLRKAEEDESALRRQVHELQAELDHARDESATWHRRHDVLQARTERDRD